MAELSDARDVLVMKFFSDQLTGKMVGMTIILQGCSLQEEESLTWLVVFINVKMDMKLWHMMIQSLDFFPIKKVCHLYSVTLRG